MANKGGRPTRKDGGTRHRFQLDMTDEEFAQLTAIRNHLAASSYADGCRAVVREYVERNNLHYEVQRLLGVFRQQAGGEAQIPPPLIDTQH